eukprot:8277904-Alexandrium_andersonii.AAC.1
MARWRTLIRTQLTPSRQRRRTTAPPARNPSGAKRRRSDYVARPAGVGLVDGGARVAVAGPVPCRRAARFSREAPHLTE